MKSILRIKKNKKGLSAVVTTVLLIALTVTMIAIVWGVVNGLVNKQTSSAGSCFDVFGKLNINGRYTCYNSTTKEFQFSIDVGDLDVDGALVAISSEGNSVSFNLGKEITQIDNLAAYPSHNPNVSLPGKNSGKTYYFNMSSAGFTSGPDSIRISPLIGTNQCETTDTLDQIDSCQALIS